MVRLKHDINDKDLAAITGVLNGFTVTIERLRQTLEDLSRKGISIKASILGFPVFSGEVKINEDS